MLRVIGQSLVLMFLLVGPATAMEGQSRVLDLIKSSGIDVQIKSYPELVRQGMAQNNRPNAPQLPPTLRDKFELLVEEAYDPLTILSQIISALDQGLTDAEIEQVLAWLDTPLGRKITELENNATRPETQERIRRLTAELDTSAIAGSRKALLQRMDEAIQVTEMTVDLVINTQIAVATAILSAMAVPEQVSPQMLRGNIERNRMNLRGQMGQHMFVSLYETYRELGDQQLLQYVEFAEGRLGGKFHRLINGAISEALLVASQKFGQSVAETLKQEQWPGRQ